MPNEVALDGNCVSTQLLMYIALNRAPRPCCKADVHHAEEGFESLI